jgi:hypothetical protein
MTQKGRKIHSNRNSPSIGEEEETQEENDTVDSYGIPHIRVDSRDSSLDSSAINSSCEARNREIPKAPKLKSKKNGKLLARLSFLNLKSVGDADTVERSSSVRVSLFKRIIRSKSKENVLVDPKDDVKNSETLNRVRSFSENNVLNVEPMHSSRSMQNLKAYAEQELNVQEALCLLRSRVGSLESARLIYNISEAATTLARKGDGHKINEYSSIITNGREEGIGGGGGGVVVLTEPEDSAKKAQKKFSFSPFAYIMSSMSSGSGSSQKEVAEQQQEQVNTVIRQLSRRKIILTQYFSGEKVPKIPLDRYLGRLVRYFDAYHDQFPSPNSAGMRSLVASVIYVDRLRAMNLDFQVTSYNVHRLLLVAMLLAIKFAEDEHPSNEYVAGVGGLEVSELCDLEIRFCLAIQFNFMISIEELRGVLHNFDDVQRHEICEPEDSNIS